MSEILHKPASEYTWVELGPIPGVPGWHIQSKPTSYPFPTENAAIKFAINARLEYPGREVVVVTTDGERL